MSTTAQPATARCKVCSAPSAQFGEAVVLNKYPVKYYRCQSCGFMQTEDPYWLSEAYSTAIAGQDVGIMSRNLINCEVASAVLNLVLPHAKNAVDYGGGHGILVRLMRDKGFNYYWRDLHASNDFARGFEAQEGQRFDFLSSFEVLEHLVDPISEIAKLMDLSENVFVSTSPVPEPVPSLQDWWYYMPSSGQHVSFYTRKSLEVIARHFHKHLLTVGPFHLFTARPAKYFLYRLACSPRAARLINKAYSRPSLIPGDLTRMTQ